MSEHTAKYVLFVAAALLSDCGQQHESPPPQWIEFGCLRPADNVVDAEHLIGGWVMGDRTFQSHIFARSGSRFRSLEHSWNSVAISPDDLETWLRLLREQRGPVYEADSMYAPPPFLPVDPWPSPPPLVALCVYADNAPSDADLWTGCATLRRDGAAPATRELIDHIDRSCNDALNAYVEWSAYFADAGSGEGGGADAGADAGSGASAGSGS